MKRLVLLVALFFVGCASPHGMPSDTTSSPAQTIKASAKQVTAEAADITKHAVAIDKATPAALKPHISPHTSAIRLDAHVLATDTAPKLTSASVDAGKVAAERDKWKADDLARQQKDVRQVHDALMWVFFAILAFGALCSIGIAFSLYSGAGLGAVKTTTMLAGGAFALAGADWYFMQHWKLILTLCVIGAIGAGVLILLKDIGITGLTKAFGKVVQGVENATAAGTSGGVPVKGHILAAAAGAEKLVRKEVDRIKAMFGIASARPSPA